MHSIVWKMWKSWRRILYVCVCACVCEGACHCASVCVCVCQCITGEDISLNIIFKVRWCICAVWGCYNLADISFPNALRHVTRIEREREREREGSWTLDNFSLSHICSTSQEAQEARYTPEHGRRYSFDSTLHCHLRRLLTAPPPNSFYMESSLHSPRRMLKDRF